MKRPIHCAKNKFSCTFSNLGNHQSFLYEHWLNKQYAKFGLLEWDG